MSGKDRLRGLFAGFNFKTRSAIVLVVLAAATSFLVAGAGAQPVVVDPDWTLIRSIEVTGPMAAHYNPRNGQIYFGKRGSGSDGLYRIDAFGFQEKLAGGSNVAAVAVQPDSGHVFFSEDYGGVIYRTAYGAVGRATWVSGWLSGDDDPVGMAFAPTGHSSGVLQAGEALVVDRGNNGGDTVWWWTPELAQGEYLVHPDDGTMVDPVDVAIGYAAVYVVDSGLSETGAIYILEPDSTLTPFSTSEVIQTPEGIAFDPLTGDLLVLDRAAGRLVRIDPATGVVSDMVTGLSTSNAYWAGVDVAHDGRRVLVTDHAAERIYVFAKCDATGQPDLDCNENGVDDYCEIIQGSAYDCNHNWTPDACELAENDCNLDGLPDDCPVCPPVQVVFIMDTSTSMNDEAAVLCASMGLIVDYLLQAGIAVQPTLFGICNNPGGDYACLEAVLTDSLGTAVPGSPPANIETLGTCPGGNEVCQEDWGRATAVVAGLYPWLPESESIRLVIPLSDEGSWCGDPVTQNDLDAVAHAITVAQDNGVIVSPITGTGSGGSVIALAQDIAGATGGTQFSSSTSANDIAYAIVELVRDACAAFTDCDGNAVLDECDLALDPGLDFNGDGVLDVCQQGVAGNIPDSVLGNRLHQSFPNPFNPSTTIAFELPREQVVSLRVYDLVGRLVDILMEDEIVPAGRTDVVWRGRDQMGRVVPAGVYFYRLNAESFSETKRMVLVK